jgi:hypothetical protein
VQAPEATPSPSATLSDSCGNNNEVRHTSLTRIGMDVGLTQQQYIQLERGGIRHQLEQTGPTTGKQPPHVQETKAKERERRGGGAPRHTRHGGHDY